MCVVCFMLCTPLLLLLPPPPPLLLLLLFLLLVVVVVVVVVVNSGMEQAICELRDAPEGPPSKLRRSAVRARR